MHLTIEGSFKKGKVELNEIPQGLPEGKVLVTFITDTGSRKNSTIMRFGQFSGPGENMATEADFACAQWRGDLTNDN